MKSLYVICSLAPSNQKSWPRLYKEVSRLVERRVSDRKVGDPRFDSQLAMGRSLHGKDTLR